MNQKVMILDGALGTQIQAAGLKPGEMPELFGMAHPDRVKKIHADYIAAGSQVIYANTFGANAYKLKGSGVSVFDVVTANVKLAREVADASGGIEVALDVGPIGELLEPHGTLTFEAAYDVFAEIVKAGEAAGADRVVFETFTDLYEMKAAVLAAKEQTALPIWATMTFEKNRRTFLGVRLDSAVVTLDALGVEAIGINCSLGPAEIAPMLVEMAEWTDKPLIAKPNAGLPDPKTGTYGLSADAFAKEMEPILAMGISMAGGCCGTTPDYIRALAATADRTAPDAESSASARNTDDMGFPVLQPVKRTGNGKRRGICSPGHMAEYGRINIIGERINPTGKKRLQQALREEDLDYIKALAIEQEEAGADILDINVGTQGVDEKALVVKVVKAVQSVVDLPLQIDSADPAVIEAGLRVCNGRAIINSDNGEKERMDAMFPLAKHYGAALLGLAMDEDGIPQTCEKRLEIASRLQAEFERYDMHREDLIIDCLTLTVSAQQEQAVETLRAVQTIHETFGLHCALGVSNISFGLPAKVHVTENFLIQALTLGLDFPIINPNEKIIRDAVVSFRALSGEDASCEAYIAHFSEEEAQRKARLAEKKKKQTADPGNAGTQDVKTNTKENAAVPDADHTDAALEHAILKGAVKEVEEAVEKLLATTPGMQIINEKIIPALDEVGKRYESGVYFLPQLLNAAKAACGGLELIKDRMEKAGEAQLSKGKIILATVQGDIHDIGKNIVKVVLENYGYEILDLGRDVAPETVVETAVREDVSLIGLSALMTTTVPAMRRTIEALHESGHPCHVMVGGAVLTPEYAKEIGADYYAKDAQESAQIAKQHFGS